MGYQPLVSNIPLNVSMPSSIGGIAMDKNVVILGNRQMGIKWQHMPQIKQYPMSQVPMKMMPMTPVVMIPNSGVKMVPSHLCNLNPHQINQMATSNTDKNRRMCVARAMTTATTAAATSASIASGTNYSGKQSHITTTNMALDLQLQDLVAICLGRIYQTNGIWISLVSERDIIDHLKSSFLQRLGVMYNEACKFHQYSLDLEKKRLSNKKSIISPDQDLKPLTEYFWHKGRMERIMKNYKNIAKMTIEQKDDDKSDKDKGASMNTDSDTNNSGFFNTNIGGSQINSMSISRVSPNVMQTIEYSEVAYNQRILLAKVNLQNIRATLCGDKCEKFMPGVFRHSQLNLIESMLSRT